MVSHQKTRISPLSDCSSQLFSPHTAFTLTTTLYQPKFSRKQFYKVWFKVTQFLAKLSKMMWPTFCYSTLFQIHILKKMSYVKCGLWTIFAKSCNCLAAKKCEAIGNLDLQFVNLPLLFNLWTSIINNFLPRWSIDMYLAFPWARLKLKLWCDG